MAVGGREFLHLNKNRLYIVFSTNTTFVPNTQGYSTHPLKLH